MRLPAYILALVLTPPAHALGNAAFSVDPEKILELAIGAIIEQYPEIFLDDLKKPSKTFISCFSTRPDDQLFPLDERFQPCNAFVQFDLGPTHVESRFRDRDNNCIVSADPEDVQIQINEDGVMGAWLRPGSGKQDRIVECTEEFMQLRNPPPVEPLDAEPFYINEEEIVRIAYLAALAAHPDIAPDDLDLDKRIRLSCSARRTAGWESVLETAFEPCNARVTFAVKSISVDFKYVDKRDWCIVGKNYDGLTVRVNADGSTQVGPRDETPGSGRKVECNEDFYNSLVPTLE